MCQWVLEEFHLPHLLTREVPPTERRPRARVWTLPVSLKPER
jgi:hypothetical protein